MDREVSGLETLRYAAVPRGMDFGEALWFAVQGWGATAIILVIAYWIGKQQFPDDVGGRFLVMGVLFLLFVGLGGMDWWTFGQWQGMPWDSPPAPIR